MEKLKLEQRSNAIIFAVGCQTRFLFFAKLLSSTMCYKIFYVNGHERSSSKEAAQQRALVAVAAASRKYT